MERIIARMRVCDIGGPTFGMVTRTNVCCFEVKLDWDNSVVRLSQSAVFTVEDGRVTLVCNQSGMTAHLCTERHHPPRKP